MIKRYSIFLILSAIVAIPLGHTQMTNSPGAIGQPTAVSTLPDRGTSMQQVENMFGQPREKLTSVGNPPVTRWIYNDFTVYFEHQYVIHTVTTKK